jgi:N-acetylmuramoyl-L-alanine amidase
MLRKLILLFALLLCGILLSKLHAQDQHFTLNTVVIDAGHGGKDPGTVFGTLYEKDIVLEVALQAGKMINEAHPGVNVIYTRTKDVFVPLDQRANIANKAKADLFISIHVNYYQKETAYGAETYILGTHRSEDNLKVAQMENSVILLEDDYTTRYEGFDPNSAESYIMFELIQNEFLEQSRFFADKVQQSFKKVAHRHNRGVKQAGFLVLRKTVMPGILIELGYISNINDRAYMQTPQGQTALAKSIADAFGEYKIRIDSRSNILLSESAETTKDSVQPETSKITPVAVNENSILKGEWYAVQIMASAKPIDTKKLGIDKAMQVHQIYENEYYKYYTGFTKDYGKAIGYQQRLNNQYKGAFLVVFRNGQKEKFRKL